MDIFADAVGIARFFSPKNSLCFKFLEAVEGRILPPLPAPLQFSPVRIKQDQPPQQRGESWDDYCNRLTGHFKDAQGRLRSTDGRLSLLDDKNLRAYHREATIFYDRVKGSYDMSALRSKYSL